MSKADGRSRASAVVADDWGPGESNVWLLCQEWKEGHLSRSPEPVREIIDMDEQDVWSCPSWIAMFFLWPCLLKLLHLQSFGGKIIQYRHPREAMTAPDPQIDTLLCELYGLTEAEIKIVEGGWQRIWERISVRIMEANFTSPIDVEAIKPYLLNNNKVGN